jgi:hypothetical protein
MTIGHLVECITGKACALAGYFGDGTAYQSFGISQYAGILNAHNFHSSGNELLYNGMTGQQIEAEIFFGPTYYMRLKHMVKDKINFRTQGPRTALTRQPVSGRANDGGLRIGEMERDGLIAHGAASMLTESMMERGDKYYMAVCNKTGMIAVYNPDKNLFLSPMADGPLKFAGSLAENNLSVDNISKHGRDFSIVRVPYSLKLLIQELQTINVVMRIITDENIEQIENMSFSKNINILLNKKGEVSLKEYMKDIQNKHKFSQGPLQEPEKEKEEKQAFIEYNRYVPTSPEYAPGSPLYDPGSPFINEDDEMGPHTPRDSPLFAPSSPDYPPPSPEYSKESMPEHLLRGGQREYKLGELVSLNSFMGENNLWNILNIGDEFITIQKCNPAALMMGGGGTKNIDDIKIVQPMDISPATLIPQQLQGQGQGQEFWSEAPPLLSANPFQKAPEFNITLVNGNNNEIDGKPVENKNKENIQISEYKKEDRKDEKTDEKKGGSSENTSSTSGGGLWDSIFQSANFLVKKSTS